MISTTTEIHLESGFPLFVLSERNLPLQTFVVSFVRRMKVKVFILVLG